jgi:hypothetical protein
VGPHEAGVGLGQGGLTSPPRCWRRSSWKRSSSACRSTTPGAEGPAAAVGDLQGQAPEGGPSAHQQGVQGARLDQRGAANQGRVHTGCATTVPVGGAGVLAEVAGGGRRVARVLTRGGGKGAGRGAAESAARTPRQHQAPPAAAEGAQLGKSKALESQKRCWQQTEQRGSNQHTGSQPW